MAELSLEYKRAQIELFLDQALCPLTDEQKIALSNILTILHNIETGQVIPGIVPSVHTGI